MYRLCVTYFLNFKLKGLPRYKYSIVFDTGIKCETILDNIDPEEIWKTKNKFGIKYDKIKEINEVRINGMKVEMI